VSDHTVHQLIMNCASLRSLSVANCTLITDNALLDIAAHATHLRYVTLRHVTWHVTSSHVTLRTVF